MAMCWHATGRDTSLGREPVKCTRALPPSHFSLKIESFEVLSTLEKYHSGLFEAGGCKWSLCLYPNGNKHDNGSGYISLYLSLEELSSKEPHTSQTVEMNYKLFVKSRDGYLTIQDADGAISSFQGLGARCGFPRFLSLKKFKNPSNGYLEKDYCTFGAEVLVIQPPQKDSFTLTRYPPQNTFTLKIEHWSDLSTDHHSTGFKFEGIEWKLLVYPQGDADSKGKSLSVYLEVQGLTEKMKVYAEFNLRVLDQLKSNHKQKQFKCWLSASCPQGDADFMPLKDLQKKSAKGFVYNDTLIVEVQICVISKYSKQ